MREFQNRLQLFPYEEAIRQTLVINSGQLEKYIWLELPHSIAKYLSLYEIAEMRSSIDINSSSRGITASSSSSSDDDSDSSSSSSGVTYCECCDCITGIGTGAGLVNVDFTDKLTQVSGKPWLRMETDLLNTDPGFHMYKFSFVDIGIDDIVSLYLTYHIQTDTPNQSSYVYM